MPIRYRQARVKIYRKSAAYPFYRIAYRAGGKRVVRSFKTYSGARSEAKRIARQISQGKESVALLSPKDALAYRFATGKLAQLEADLNARRTDAMEADITLSLEEAVLEYVLTTG